MQTHARPRPRRTAFDTTRGFRPPARLLAAAAALLIGLAPTSDAQTPLRLEAVAQGLDSPVWVGAPEGDDRVFVIELNSALIKIVRDGVVLPQPFLDLSSKVDAFSVGGLIGMAFHPQFELNGRFFVYYTAPPDEFLPGFFVMDIVLESYQVSVDPDVADPASGELILEDLHYGPNHKGGGPVFGPDGLLYVAIGEGESLAADSCLAAGLDNWFGKILRIDVDGAAPYEVPADNPFVGTPGALPEIYHLGLRNPWGVSFDSATGELYIGDVGNFAFEEINIAAPGQSGLNFGFPSVEGDDCNPNTCPGIVPPCGDAAYTAPAHAYANFGSAVIGGHVYRGSAIPDLAGTYFYADFPGGGLWSFRYQAGSGVTQLQDRKAELDPFDVYGQASRLGLDGHGELLLTTIGTTGAVYRIVPDVDPTYCTSKTVQLPSGQCTPVIASQVGIPSFALPTPYVIDASDILNSKAGFFFYGANGPAALPLQGGTLCVAPPVKRTSLQYSGGSPPPAQDCSGTYTFDFNAWIQDGKDPGLVEPGTQVFGQFWFRVPSAPFGVGFTNAIAFTVGP